MVTCYLDTAHWNKLASGQLDAVGFRRLVKRRKICPVLSFIHVLELALRKPKSTRDMVSRFITDISASGCVKWVHMRGVVEAAELMTEFRRFAQLSVNRFKPFAGCLADVVPSGLSATRELAFRQEPFHVQMESLQESLDYKSTYQVLRKREHPRYVSRKLLHPVERALGMQNGFIVRPDGSIRLIDRPLEQAFRSQFSLERCPSVNLTYSYYSKWTANPAAVHVSDLEDVFHLTGCAYSDCSFVDKRTRDILTQAGAKRLPMKNEEFGAWLQSY